MPLVLLCFQCRALAIGAATIDIFLAVDRGHVRRVFIQIGPPDSELLAVGVDPLPQFFARGPAFGTVRALDAHEVGRKPAPVAAAQGPAVIRAVACGLEAACNRLPVVIAERAGDARLKPGRIQGAQKTTELEPKGS